MTLKSNGRGECQSVSVPANTGHIPVANQSRFTTMEMNASGGAITFSNLTGTGTDPLSVGDKWQLSVVGAPPNSPLRVQLDGPDYPPQFKTVGVTDAKGNLTLSGTVSQQDQASGEVYQRYSMQFPNSVGRYDKNGYQDPNAPAGMRNVLVALVAYSVA